MSQPEREIVVTRHAVATLQARRPLVYSELPLSRVSKVIRREVRMAIDAGRIDRHKPLGFGLYGEKKARLPDHQRVVWSAGSEFAWIIARESAVDVVITTLVRASAAE